jgi:hypothetical protein
VPDLVGTFRQVIPGNFAATTWIKQTKLDALGMSREYREIRSETVPSGTQRMMAASIQLRG